MSLLFFSLDFSILCLKSVVDRLVSSSLFFSIIHRFNCRPPFFISPTSHPKSSRFHNCRPVGIGIFFLSSCLPFFHANLDSDCIADSYHISLTYDINLETHIVHSDPFVHLHLRLTRFFTLRLPQIHCRRSQRSQQPLTSHSYNAVAAIQFSPR